MQLRSGSLLSRRRWKLYRGFNSQQSYNDDWQRALDEISNTDLETAMDGAGEGSEQLRLKRPVALGISLGAHKFLIMEYTRPNNTTTDAIQAINALKTTPYTQLHNRLLRLLPGWKVEIQTYTMGISRTFSSTIWQANPTAFWLKGKKVDSIVCKQAAHTLTELTALYNTCHAALQQSSHDAA